MDVIIDVLCSSGVARYQIFFDKNRSIIEYVHLILSDETQLVIKFSYEQLCAYCSING